MDKIYLKVKFIAQIVLLLLCLVSLVRLDSIAATGASEVLEQKLSVKFESVSLKQALEMLEKETGLEFVYSSDFIPDQTEVTKQFKDEALINILKELFQPLNISGVLINNQVVLRRKAQDFKIEQEAYGVVYGIVRDATTGEPLPYATITVSGTNIGTTTDVNGQYLLKKVPAGPQEIIYSFVGYAKKSLRLNVLPDEAMIQNVDLDYEVTMADEVVISGQALGQAAAINQQINANTIVNVVSKDKINELPDQNAAEAVGRLPGIAVQRDGGEGQKVVVRGLSPRLNSITVNGERIPSTDAENRSVDLSMISPSQLEGIEVYKALTPDQDADAVGGSVNFLVKKAPEGQELRIRAETGYNSLEDEYDQYRVNVSGSDRFLENRLGVLLTGNYQRANRSSDVLTADWGTPIDPERVDLLGYSIVNIQEIRKRYGGSLALDYRLNSRGDLLVFSTLWGETDRDEVRRRRSLEIVENQQDYEIRDRQLSTRVVSSSLRGSHNLVNTGLEIDWNTSYSLSRQNTPFSHRLRFREFNAFDIPPGGFAPGATPEEINQFARNDVNSAFLRRGELDEDVISEDAYTAKVDLKHNITIGSGIRGYIKGGLKFRLFDRSRDAVQFRDNGNGPQDGFEELVMDYPNEYTPVENSPVLISMSNFIGSFQPNDYLEGDLNFGPGLSRSASKRFAEFFAPQYYYRNDLVDNEDYQAQGAISAAYIMGEFNIDKLMLMGGVRVERTDAEYIGFETFSVDDDELGEGEVGEAFIQRNTNNISYTEFLPMLHARYRFNDNMDLRFAYTHSLARQDFQNLVPWASVNAFAATANLGNPQLSHMTAENLDLFLSYYNKFGLFTIGAFYKTLDDVDVDSRFIDTNRKSDLFGFDVTQPINLPRTTMVRGIELDAQFNLRYLEGFLSGIVLYANFTLINSDTYYPIFRREGNSGEQYFNPFFNQAVRGGRLPGQPDITSNFSLGYERNGFSGRISMTLQENSFDELGPNELFDSYTDLLVRWDATANYSVTKRLKIYGNWNNITNTPNCAFQFSDQYETNREFYGFTADLGIIYTLTNE